MVNGDITGSITNLVGIGVTAGLGFAVIDLVGRQTENLSDFDRPRKKGKKSKARRDDFTDFGDAFDMEFRF